MDMTIEFFYYEMRQITINAKWHACWITKSAALRCSNVLRSSVPTGNEYLTSDYHSVCKTLYERLQYFDYNTEHTAIEFFACARMVCTVPHCNELKKLAEDKE